MTKQKFLIKQSELDDFQRRVLNRRSDSSLVIKGCAGSGKSLLALWKMHDIVTNEKGSAQVVVFTKSLTNYFLEGCREAGITNCPVKNWHQWKKDPKRTDFILVDEAQDFSQNEINLLRECANKALLLYGDSSQQIYKFKERNDGARINMDSIGATMGYPTEQLVFNHRLPQKIASIAEYVNAEHDDLVGRCQKEGFEKPYFLKYPNLESQLDAIFDITQAREYEDIGILFPKNDQVCHAVEYLRKKGMVVEASYTGYDNLNFATSNAKATTYHKAKGLQFEAVFLPHCEESQMDKFIEPLYVAITRTYQSLFLLYSDQLPKSLNKAPHELYETSIRPKETELL